MYFYKEPKKKKDLCIWIKRVKKHNKIANNPDKYTKAEIKAEFEKYKKEIRLKINKHYLSVLKYQERQKQNL